MWYMSCGSGCDLVELQGVVEVRFADFQLRRERRQFDVGHDAAILRAVAAGAVELLDRHLQRAEVLVVRDAEQVRCPGRSSCCTVPLPCVAWSPITMPRP